MYAGRAFAAAYVSPEINPMSDGQFPSGQWVGFYTYASLSKRYLMDLILEFRDGHIAGEGADGIGLFGIDGRYYPKEGECNWIKTYFGRHSVEYSGFREQKGIWGTWTIGPTKGGFHIWPIGEGATLEKLRAEAEDEFPVRITQPHPPNQVPEPARTLDLICP
jgi:hypothetical protein